MLWGSIHGCTESDVVELRHPEGRFRYHTHIREQEHKGSATQYPIW